MKKSNEYDGLKLCNQVCFPLYACSKELVRQYGPYLKELDLTYTQYIVMMVMWEKETASSRELAECLHLDYGTLTPVLKRLELAGYISMYQFLKYYNIPVTIIVTKSDKVPKSKKERNLRQRQSTYPERLQRRSDLPKKNLKRFINLLTKHLRTWNRLIER